MKRQHIILILILIVAAFMRFYMLADRGIFLPDEGYFLNGAKTYLAAGSYFFKKVITQNTDFTLRDYLLKYGGAYPYSGKPGIYPLIVLSFLVLGIHDYSHLFLSAGLGIASVFLTYLIGKELYGRKVGTIAALLLAVSPYHINYSRSGLTVAASIFFILFTIYFYIRSERQPKTYNIILAGIFAASAHACHYNLLWFFPFMVFVEVLRYLSTKKTTLFAEAKRLSIFVLSYVITFGIYILPYQVGKYFTQGLTTRSGKPYQVESYFETMKGIVRDEGGAANFSWQNSTYYIRLLKILENPLVLVFAVIGVFVLLKRLKKKFNAPEFIVLFFCIFPIILWSFFGYKGGRTIAMLIPFFVLSAGYAISWFDAKIINNVKFRQIILAFLIFLVVGVSIDKSIPIIEYKSEYKKAIDFMRGQGNIRHISNMAPVSVFYVTDENTNAISFLTIKEIVSLYKDKNYAFFLKACGSEVGLRTRELHDFMAKKKVKPVFTAGSDPYMAFFDFGYIGNEEERRKLMGIEIYRLKDILE